MCVHAESLSLEKFPPIQKGAVEPRASPAVESLPPLPEEGESPSPSSSFDKGEKKQRKSCAAYA